MTAHPALELMLRNQAKVHAARKRWAEVTVGEYQAMTPEQRAEYDTEWWRRVTREEDLPAEPRGFTGPGGDDNRDGPMAPHEWGE